MNQLKKWNEELRKTVDAHINKQNAKRDEFMDETDASSFSPPPPQPPGAPRVSKTERRNIRRAEKDAESEPPLAIRDRSRSRYPEPIIEEPQKGTRKNSWRGIYSKKKANQKNNR